MNNAIESEEYKGFTIEIVPDDSAESPREWDNLGIMVCWHRRYTLGDDRPKFERNLSPQEWIIQWLQLNGKPIGSDVMKEFQKYNLVIPIMAYEHGGITIRAYDYGNFPDQNWDCGQLGFIYVPYSKIKQEWNVKRLSKATIQKATKCLISEINVYDDYLTGSVYGYRVINSDGDTVDSCYGFFGEDGIKEAKQEARDSADYFADQAQKEQDAMDQRLAIATAHS